MPSIDLAIPLGNGRDFSTENHHLSGAIPHSVCIFNIYSQEKEKFILQFVPTMLPSFRVIWPPDLSRIPDFNAKIEKLLGQIQRFLLHFQWKIRVNSTFLSHCQCTIRVNSSFLSHFQRKSYRSLRRTSACRQILIIFQRKKGRKNLSSFFRLKNHLDMKLGRNQNIYI